MMPPTLNQADFSYEDRVRMRRWLDSEDQKQAGGMKEFDLAKPPVPAYQYREYPFLMYHHASGVAKPARNYEERHIMLAQGWSESAAREEAHAQNGTTVHRPLPNGDTPAALLDRIMSMSDEDRLNLILVLKSMEPPKPEPQPEPEPEPEPEIKSRKRQQP